MIADAFMPSSIPSVRSKVMLTLNLLLPPALRPTVSILSILVTYDLPGSASKVTMAFCPGLSSRMSISSTETSRRMVSWGVTVINCVRSWV